jgi:hypothetical protein
MNGRPARAPHEIGTTCAAATIQYPTLRAALRSRAATRAERVDSRTENEEAQQLVRLIDARKPVTVSKWALASALRYVRDGTGTCPIDAEAHAELLDGHGMPDAYVVDPDRVTSGHTETARCTGTLAACYTTRRYTQRSSCRPLGASF